MINKYIKQAKQNDRQKSGAFIKLRLLPTFLLIVTFLLLVGCENKLSTQRGSISGLVTDSAGRIIEEAIITSHRSLFKAETNKKGLYTLTSLDVGSHRLMVEKNGYFLASRTIDLGYGQVLEGINIQVEALEKMITFAASRRETARIVLEVNCKEPMSVWAGWREIGSARLQTPPTEKALQHQIVLSGLFPHASYLIEIEGVAADGRRYISSQETFKTLSRDDVPGAPDAVSHISVTQGGAGALLQWQYTGLDPIQGFRVFRRQDGSALRLLFNEQVVTSSYASIVDETTAPGRFYTYALQCVDLDGNVSSYSENVSIIPAGKIREDITWTKALSPILINGDIIVPAGRTLKLEPGVTVSFSAEDAGRTGFSPMFCEMIVEGTVIADGTAAEPIKFISGSSLPGKRDWYGLRVIAARTQNMSILKNIIIAGAEHGVALHDAEVTLENYTARYCERGLSLNGASGTVLLNLSFEDCETGFAAENTWYCSATNLTANNCGIGAVLTGNSYFALNQFDVRNSRDLAVKVVDRNSPILRNGVLHSFKTGLLAGGASGDFQYLTVDAAAGVLVDGADVALIRNNIIVNRENPGTGFGIEEKTLGRSYQYNNIFGFLQATVNCDQLGAIIINADPQFVGSVNGKFDYSLQGSSPLVTASDQGTQIGAYGSDG